MIPFPLSSLTSFMNMLETNIVYLRKLVSSATELKDAIQSQTRDLQRRQAILSTSCKTMRPKTKRWIPNYNFALIRIIKKKKKKKRSAEVEKQYAGTSTTELTVPVPLQAQDM